jgi:putative hydrolase of the HAD superfamily
MVGDDFNADVLGPNNASIRSVWFVPNGLTPIPQIPVQSGEIHSMSELPGIVDDLIVSPLPTISECDSLLRTYSNNPNLLRHVTMVALVAYLVAELCVENGYSVNPILAHRGGLLHDLDKLICLKTNMEHGQETNRILQTSGYSI